MIDFSSYAADRANDFTGREWVFKEIDGWLAEAQAPKFFIITGTPASGKTAIAARLVQFTQGTASPPAGLPLLLPGFIDAVHFCGQSEPHVRCL